MHCEDQGTVFISGGSGRGLGPVALLQPRAKEGSGRPTGGTTFPPWHPYPCRPAQKCDRGHLCLSCMVTGAIMSPSPCRSPVH